MIPRDALQDSFDTGATTIARAWAVTRRDGVMLGFTDHDQRVAFLGMSFDPASGMTARALSQGTGLSVDNSEGYGALSSDAIREEDILAGRFDGAEIRHWLVDWAHPERHRMIFRGTFGEVSRAGGAFNVELRGLSEPLGAVTGRVYHPRCGAILGDRACRVDLSQPGFQREDAVIAVEGAQIIQIAEQIGVDDRWFEKGTLRVLSGEAAGLLGVIKSDLGPVGSARRIELWQRLGAEIRAGDRIRLEAGCDRRAETCRAKFNNFLNFRGFPHIPGEDWISAYPGASGGYDGGSLFS